MAYAQLFMASTLVSVTPKPWKRYLPAYKKLDPNAIQRLNAPQTQRGMANLLQLIGTPAAPCIPRGKPPGRRVGELVEPRDTQPIVFKTKNKKKISTQTSKVILFGEELTASVSSPQTMARLITLLRTNLDKLNISVEKFAQQLIDSS